MVSLLTEDINEYLKYDEVIDFDKAVIESYDLVETDTELYITERVNNFLFKKILLSG